MTKARVGIWLIGAQGGVATTAIVGLIALERKWIGGTGSVSELPRFQHLDLPSWDSFVVGGHEIRGVRLADEAARLMVEMRPAVADLAQRCRDELDAIDARIRPGTMRNVGPTIAAGWPTRSFSGTHGRNRPPRPSPACSRTSASSPARTSWSTSWS